jgi:hypothetical protein
MVTIRTGMSWRPLEEYYGDHMRIAVIVGVVVSW